MIILKSLKWSNWFSYGESNKIIFTDNRVTQLLGKVGSGKSSIPLIIQEVLYSKNSKGIKKGNIRNRNSSNEVFAELIFTKDNVEYVILLTRKANIKVQFIRNGEDISEHTAQNTYKLIEEILGLNFDLFSQLTYQSSKTSLEFLTSTDTNRKKFLISLFSLDKYVHIFEAYKAAIRGVENEIAIISGAINTIVSFIAKNEGIEIVEVDILPVPEIPEELPKKQQRIIAEITNIDANNSNILKNNQYKEMLECIDREKLEQPDKVKLSVESEKNRKQELLADKRHLESELKKIGILKDVCHVCSQPIDNSEKKKLVEQYTTNIAQIQKKVEDLDVVLKEATIIDNMWSQYMNATREFEQLINYINPNLPEEPSNKEDLVKELAAIKNDIEELTKAIKTIQDKNKKAEVTNAQSKLIAKQLEDYRKELEIHKLTEVELSRLVSDLGILRDIFSTKGLVNYKIQYLVADLQTEISKYLEQLSSGRFSLEFRLVADKLNIVIYDGEHAIDIEALSSGEMAVINIATLLAIRSIMSSISNTKLNILFLDESINVLDNEFRESLVECLLEEHDLNIYIMSHNYQHPLVPSLNIIKTNGVSRIERTT
jgi:DNA repair exonuclease SbcCD ATPase subunit